MKLDQTSNVALRRCSPEDRTAATSFGMQLSFAARARYPDTSVADITPCALDACRRRRGEGHDQQRGDDAVAGQGKKVGYHGSLLALVMFVGGLREIATSGIKGFRRLAAHRRFRASVPLSVASNQ